MATAQAPSFVQSNTLDTSSFMFVKTEKDKSQTEDPFEPEFSKWFNDSVPSSGNTTQPQQMQGIQQGFSFPLNNSAISMTTSFPTLPYWALPTQTQAQSINGVNSQMFHLGGTPMFALNTNGTQQSAQAAAQMYPYAIAHPTAGASGYPNGPGIIYAFPNGTIYQGSYQHGPMLSLVGCTNNSNNPAATGVQTRQIGVESTAILNNQIPNSSPSSSSSNQTQSFQPIPHIMNGINQSSPSLSTSASSSSSTSASQQQQHGMILPNFGTFPQQQLMVAPFMQYNSSSQHQFIPKSSTQSNTTTMMMSTSPSLSSSSSSSSNGSSNNNNNAIIPGDDPSSDDTTSRKRSRSNSSSTSSSTSSSPSKPTQRRVRQTRPKVVEAKGAIQCRGRNRKKGTQCRNAALMEYVGPRPIYCAEHIELDPNSFYEKCKSSYQKEIGDKKGCKEVVLKEYGLCYKHYPDIVSEMVRNRDIDKARHHADRISYHLETLEREAADAKKKDGDLFQRKNKLIPKFQDMKKAIMKGIDQIENGCYGNMNNSNHSSSTTTTSTTTTITLPSSIIAGDISIKNDNNDLTGDDLIGIFNNSSSSSSSSIIPLNNLSLSSSSLSSSVGSSSYMSCSTSFITSSDDNSSHSTPEQIIDDPSDISSSNHSSPISGDVHFLHDMDSLR